MALEQAQAVVETAPERGLKMVAHSHRPDQNRRGLEIVEGAAESCKILAT